MDVKKEVKKKGKKKAKKKVKKKPVKLTPAEVIKKLREKTVTNLIAEYVDQGFIKA